MPQPRCVNGASGGQKLAIGTEHHVLYRVLVTNEWLRPPPP